MARRKESRPTFTADSIKNVVDRMVEEEERRRAGQRARYAPKPVTLSTGRWIRCPDCKGGGVIGWTEARERNLPNIGVRQAGVRCPRCEGDGEILEPKAPPL